MPQLVEIGSDRLRMAVRESGRPAVTHYRVIERFERIPGLVGCSSRPVELIRYACTCRI